MMGMGRLMTGWDGNPANPTVIPHAIAAPPGPGAVTDVLASGPTQQGGANTIGVAGFQSVILCLRNMYAGAGVSNMTFKVYGNILPDAGHTYRELLATYAGVLKGAFEYHVIADNPWNNIEVTAQETLLVAADTSAAVVVFCQNAH
jgi:hypothetical protein